MKFMARRRQKPPTIIIISLIDILIVLLIFMMVTTTFKQKTILNLSLPQSRSESSTQVENQSVVVSIAAQSPHIYLGEQPLSEEELLAVPPHSMVVHPDSCLLYTSPSPRDKRQSRMPSSA